MNNKNFSAILKSTILVLILICSFAGSGNAQLVNGIGVTGGITYSRQNWKFSGPSSTVDLSVKRKYLLRYNGSIYAELFQHDFIRFRTEIQYNLKGSKEVIPTADGDKKYRNKVGYLCWNNFLKLRYEMFAVIPYILIGPRVEYALIKNPEVYQPVIHNFNKLHVTASAGAGVELVTFGIIKPFTEAHFNPGIMRSYGKTDNLGIKNLAWELRIGFRAAIQNSDCPPVYK